MSNFKENLLENLNHLDPFLLDLIGYAVVNYYLRHMKQSNISEDILESARDEFEKRIGQEIDLLSAEFTMWDILEMLNNEPQ